MLKTIPAHSLVIGVGPNNHTRSTYIERYFDGYEIVSPEDVCVSLVGEPYRPDLNSTVFAQIRHLIALKLSLGERVVVDAQNLRREDRVALARIATENGIPVFYLICDPAGASDFGMARFRSAERDLQRGDGLAEVIDWQNHIPHPISKHAPTLPELQSRYSGITVIADVHGMYQSFLSALSWARARNHYVVLLGDVIDYGRETLEVADEAYRLIMRGEGELIMGNHERKIARWAQQAEFGRPTVRLSDGNRVTTNAILNLSPSARSCWLGRFRGLVARSHFNRQLGNIVLTHAAVHPHFWNGTASPKEIETWSLFGEFEPGPEESRPARRYSWTTHVPSDMTVIVGHDIRSTSIPLSVQPDGAGRTIFLDTGCGKGGFLSSTDLKFVDGMLRVENFSRY